MKRIVIMACWIGMASYCVLALTVGPSGIVATNRVNAAAESMRQNLEALSSLNNDYSDELSSLQNRPESTALEARSLGYLSENETAIRLSVIPERDPPPGPGTRLDYQAVSIMSDARIKEIAGLIMLASMVVGMVLKYAAPRSSKTRQREILVQEASRS